MNIYMEANMMVSECCDSIPWNDTDICAECREHADFVKYKEKRSDQEDLRSN